MEDKTLIDYSAVVLDETSIERLLKRLEVLIPKNWTLISDLDPDIPDRTLHMTISTGPIPDHLEKYLGLNIGLWVEDYGIENGVFAVGVSGMESKNEKPHITIAINKGVGAKPVDSNKIKNWKKLKRPLKVKGKIKEIQNKQYNKLLNNIKNYD